MPGRLVLAIKYGRKLETKNCSEWSSNRKLKSSPGHPCHGHSVLDTIAASFSAFSRTNTTRQSTSPELDTESSPSSASQLLQNVSSWYETTKKSVMAKIDAPETLNSTAPLSVEPALSTLQEAGETSDEAVKGAIGGSFEQINL